MLTILEANNKAAVINCVQNYMNLICTCTCTALVLLTAVTNKVGQSCILKWEEFVELMICLQGAYRIYFKHNFLN